MVQSTIETATTPMRSSTSNNAPSNTPEVIQQQISVAKTVLLQAVELLDKHLTTDEQLTVHSQHLPGSTIGKHLRHARDHFVLLLDSIQSRSPRELSYDTRLRNTPMETSLEGARAALLDTIKQINEVLPTANFDEEITLHAITPYMHSFRTTIGREFWFANLHCVHHWSMVRVIAGEMGIQLDNDFGFAPSTLVYQERDDAPLGRVRL